MLFQARPFSSKNDKDDYSKKFESMMGSQMSDADKAAIEKEKLAKEARDVAQEAEDEINRQKTAE